ncbi:MAG: dTDP-4-dehydrorhamnose reductase [Nitrosotalea sp.]
MKFLVTGSAGFVGRQLVKDLSESSQVYSCYHKTRPDFGIPTQMDITRNGDIEKTIQSIKPDAIFHCAAMADVDLCEKEQELASKINVKATENISRQAAKIKAFLVYISTDYIFDGKNGNKKESDTPNPINHYGKTKLQGELTVQDLAPKWCIARTSIPYGTHPTRKNFLSFVIESLQARIEFQSPKDQYICPTYLPNLSRMLIELGTRQIAGIIHLSGATRVSRYEMAKMISEKLSLDTTLLRPVKISEMTNWTAKRPQDSSLDASKANKMLKEKPLDIKSGLDLYAKQLKAKA